MSTGHHHHVDPDAGDARVAAAVSINMLLTVAQIIGGIVSGSLSLIADALHNFSDAVSLIIAFAARKIARRPADGRMTFGYGRIEAVAALINYTTLVVIGLYLIYEGVARMVEPTPISGWIVVIVAGIALVIDLATAALTYSMSKTSMNIRAAFLHNLADALGSVAVIVAGTLVILYGWTWVDPAMTLLIAGYILYHALTEMPGVMRLLMLGSPPGLDTSAVIDAMEEVAGVDSAHHVHLWMMQEHSAALEAHVRLSPQAEPEQTRATLKKLLSDRFDVHHSTLEMEENGTSCAEHGHRVGHAV